MKKSFKPLGKQTKTTFRRKTIDPKIDLGIKKDEDGLENIDDYWKVAGSILEADSEVEINSIDGRKRQIINSLDSNLLTTITEDKQDNSSLVVNSTKLIEEDFNFKEDTLYNLEEIKRRVSHKTPTRLESDLLQISNTSGFEFTKEDKNVDKDVEECVEGDKGKDEKGKGKDDKGKKKNTKKTTIKDDTIKKGNDTIKAIKAIGNENRLRFKSLGMKNNTLKDKQTNNLPLSILNVGLSNASSFYSGTSEIFSLVTTDTFEMASLHLNPESKILKNVAVQSFTMYLVKGRLEIVVDGETCTIKRDSVFCIEKDSEYSITNIGERVAEAILTYNLRRE